MAVLGVALIGLLQTVPARGVAEPPLPSASTSAATQITIAGYGNGQPLSGFVANPFTPWNSATTPYPGTVPNGFVTRNVGFAGLFLANPVSGGTTQLQLYCIDIFTATGPPLGYVLGTWSEANINNVGLVAQTLTQYFPFNPAAPDSGLTDDQKAAAVQAAIWYFSDNFVLPPTDPLHSVVASIVQTVQGLGPLDAPPTPTVNITPTQISVAQGRLAGPYTVNVTGPANTATVEAFGATMFADAAGTIPIAQGAQVPNGQQIWLQSTGGSTASLQATADAVVPETNVYLYDGATAGVPEAQKLILALPAQVTATVSAEATFLPPGSLTVNKVIQGPSAGQQGAITISVICDDVELGPITIPAGATGTVPTVFNNIPANSLCTVRETGTGADINLAVTVTGSGTQVTIPSGGSQTVTITNTYTPPTGSLIVSKTIAGDGAGLQGPVTISVTCTPPGGSPTTLPPITIPGGTGAQTINNELSGIAPGSVCTATETSDGSNSAVHVTVTCGQPPAPCATNGDGQPVITVTIPQAGEGLASFTDTYGRNPGSLLITKNIVGGGKQGPIEILVDCPGAEAQGFPMTLTIDAGATGTHTFGPFTGIPAGTVCTITEPETGENDAVSVTVDGLGQVTIPAGGQASKTITDTYTPAVGSLVVTKSITGPGAGLQDEITIHVACSPNGPTQDFTIPARTGGGNLPPFTLNNIPAGSSCTVSEPANTNGSNAAVTGTVTIGPPATVTVPARGQASVDVNDDYTLNPGFIQVTKDITGTSAGSHGPIRIVVDCPDSSQQFTFDIPASVTGPQTSPVFGPIPAGTVCTVTETLNGTEGMSGLQVTITGNNQQVTVQPGVTTTASLGDDYHPNPGFLRVNKYVSGPGAGLQDAAVITVTCTPANSSTVVFQDTFTIPAGAPNGFTDSKVFGPIPAFSVCSVAENPNGSNSAVTAQVVISQESGIIISPAPTSVPTRAVAGEVDVFDNYTINNGSLVVNKNITGAAAGQQGPITITVDCPGLPTQTFNIAGGATGPQGPFTVPNIPITSANGTTCAVTETANGTENNNTINVAVTGTGDVTVPPGGQGTANITDTYTPILGGLTVKKTIAGNGVGAQGPVVITVSCTGVPPALTPDFVIGPGATTDQSMNYPNIPAGSTCTVTEVVNGGNTAVSVVTVPATGTPQNVNIPPSDTAVVNISDTYTLNQGSLVVNKNITGAAAGQQGPITITVDCPGLTQTFNINAGATGPQGPFTVSNIPIDSANGTTCNVSETRNGSTDANGTPIPTIQVTVTGEGPVTVAPGGTGTANLTNDVEPTPGSLVVTKTINGPAAGHQGPITIDVDCPGVTGFPTSFTVPAGATSFPPQVFNNIPAGSSCTVTESATVNGSTTTVRLASVTISPTQPVAVGANQTVPVDVSDIYEFNPGQIVVQKNITGAAAGQQGPITIEVDCPGLPTPSFVYTIPAGATGLQAPQTFSPVPVGTAAGSTCTVSETVNGETDTVSVAVSPVTQDVTVPPGGTGAAQTITNTATFKPGGLSVVKDIAGEGAGHQGPITISVDCPGVTGFPMSFTIPAGTGAGPYTPQQFDNIPAGTMCTVTETGTGNNTEVTVTTNPATQTVQIPAGAVAEVNVGNTIEFNPGFLVVSKAMEGPVAGQQGPVSILAQCGDQTFTFDIAANATGTQTSPPFGPIPAGTVCTVTETANGETATVEVTITGDGETEAIPPGGTATANLTDNFTPTPGELVVTKNIDGPSAGQQAAVTINVTCTLNGQTVVNTDITIPAGSKAGAYQNTVSDIPAGSSCRVLETNDGKTSIITVNVVGGDQTVTVGAAETAMVSILDSYDPPTGGIKVQKTIAGSGAGLQGEVAILVSCQQPNNVYVFRVRAGAAAGTYQQIFNYIPSGLNCTVTETEDGSNSAVTAQVSGSPQRVAVPASSIATAGMITDTYESPPTKPTPGQPGVPGQPSVPGLPSTGYGGE